MVTKSSEKEEISLLKTLPGDDVRQIMWRFQDRYDLQMVIQSTRSIARGVVARLVADGERNSHEWNEKKAQLLNAFDEAGVTAVYMDPSQGGFIEGPKNLAVALVAFELSWVDGGAATCSLAGNLALAPIHEKGTPEQKKHYMGGCIPPQPGEDRKILKGAFALTEPLPYVGVDAGLLGGKMRVAEWKEGEEPSLQIEKRGRFITNMGFANFVTVAVDSDDERIKGSCMIILEENDPGIYDRGSVTLKLVHQLSSTSDPVFNLKVPANRIIGGYTIKDGKIIPNFSHSEVIEAVFRRTRVTVALMSSAKLLSAIEPVIRYQRTRFRGSASIVSGTPRYELGIQQKEDAVQRLTDVWATGEASASLGFEAARLFDKFDPIEKEKEKLFAEKGVKGARAQLKIFKEAHKNVLEYLELLNKPEDKRDNKRFEELNSDMLVKFLATDALTNVLCPACKLWNTGYGATMMREAVSLMGGYGITEDCPGFLAQKWMDVQLEATYEGPESVQRRQLSLTMTNELFLVQFKQWINELKEIEKNNEGVGAATLSSAMELWLWTLEFLLKEKDANGKAIYHGQRQGSTFAMADALCWILAVRFQILDVLELKKRGPENPVLSEGLPGFVTFFSDLSYVQSARAAGEAGRICAELIYGYKRDSNLDENVGETFSKLRKKVDESLIGARLAKDRAGIALTQVMIPEAMDYPV